MPYKKHCVSIDCHKQQQMHLEPATNFKEWSKNHTSSSRNYNKQNETEVSKYI